MNSKTPFTLNCKGKLLSLEKPKVMGILNVTPDSFFDGGQYEQKDAILFQAEKMLKQGADIIDIGGMSSRPGAAIISTEEELKRVIPAIQAIIKYFPETIISIDTVKAKVAEFAVSEGASIINDISAGNIDEAMFETVANLDVPYILMHMQGEPLDMQDKPAYETNVVEEILDFFIRKLEHLNKLKIKDIVLDVGFGFGKTLNHNYNIMRNLEVFSCLQKPLLVGVSRKSMIYKLLQVSPKEALNGSTVLQTIALQKGASILRVHDVKEAKETIKIIEQLNVE